MLSKVNFLSKKTGNQNLGPKLQSWVRGSIILSGSLPQKFKNEVQQHGLNEESANIATSAHLERTVPNCRVWNNWLVYGTTFHSRVAAAKNNRGSSTSATSSTNSMSSLGGPRRDVRQEIRVIRRLFSFTLQTSEKTGVQAPQLCTYFEKSHQYSLGNRGVGFSLALSDLICMLEWISPMHNHLTAFSSCESVSGSLE